MATVFSLSFLLVAPFWLLMIFVPRWHWTQRMMQSALIIVPAAVLYLVLVLPQFGQVLLELLNPQLPAIAALLGTERGATIGWVHFLAFDLFVGRWVYLDSRQRDINVLLMAPILFFVLMLGPIGFLIYLVVCALQDWRSGSRPAPVYSNLL